ncbi:MAG: GIY-YIG nuclease family protein [Patescibacteria group bacterium]|jgi:predicted GIY-YIG superfamily endonuclease
MSHFYILKTNKQSYYIGSTDNLETRLKYHQGGRVKSTKDKLPIELVFKEYYKTRAEAQKKEYKVKGWKSKKMIERLIKLGPHQK